jgi:hypothetical protein
MVAVVGSTSCETGREQRPAGDAEARTVVNRRCIGNDSGSATPAEYC